MASKDDLNLLNIIAKVQNAISNDSALSFLASEAKKAVSELKELDACLTRISLANRSLSKADLARIAEDSYEIAGKYGKTASEYLSAVQDMALAGYRNADSLAELSTAVQSASEMTSDLTNRYIIAIDKAYEMNGSVRELTQTLDGARNITANNTVTMTELAEGLSEVGSLAASSQMEVNEITAAMSALIAVTQESGSDLGNAFKGILMNLQQITGEAGDGGDIIDAKSLSEYAKACADLGVSLTTVKNGAASLKEPMQILKELSEEYTRLDASDARRTNLLDAVGGDVRAEALNALLENYELYEKMLEDYADGTGSIAREAEKAANSWEGSLNRLSNTWTDTVGNIADSGAITAGINALNGLLSVINNITGALGSIGSIGLGAGLIAGIKNVGKLEMLSFILF